MKTRVTYILHYESASGEIAHYVGNTAPERLQTRFKEHSWGDGALATKKLRITHGKPRLATVLKGYEEGIDRFMNAHDTGGSLCPICQERARKTVNL